MSAIVQEISRAGLQCPELRLPRYPQSLPDIDRHLDELLAIAERWNSKPAEQNAASIRRRVCQECPHQFPTRYCPVGHTGGCVASRAAPQIVWSIAGTLKEMNSKGVQSNH